MPSTSTSRERLIEVASELFYAEGIAAVGVDRVVAQSGVSKPTLYAQFGSKAGLLAAVLSRRRDRRQAAITAYIEELPADTPSRILALFDWFAAGHARPGFRGCPFTNAAVELPDATHPARQVISEYKHWIRETLNQLAADDGLAQPRSWGSRLALLIDGANARVVISADPTAMLEAKATATLLIDAHVSSQGRPT